MNVIRCDPSLILKTDKAVGRDLSQTRNCDVCGHRHIQHNTVVPAILGNISQALPYGIARKLNFDRLAIDMDLTCIPRSQTEQRLRKLRPSRTDETGEAQDLAAPDLQTDIFDATLFRAHMANIDHHVS